MQDERGASLLPAEMCARVRIDQQLIQAGWTIQDKKVLNGHELKPDETRESVKKKGVLSRLGAFFDRFFGLAVQGREG